ncbi:ester cyclase [Paenibacillus glycanilyticus]|uniref:ester cyclase n=1 Tax=Paenibacillus glycanilyticus TaxID=126569 RepID=UPI00203AEC59|nr:ester cyclase [Paenibacillus glycanilyticus]MCM3631079.1 ester cyclase [Paenibacillus glycanilyticus]
MKKFHNKLKVLSLALTMTLGIVGTVSFSNSSHSYAAAVVGANKVEKSNQGASTSHQLKPKQVAAAFYASYNGDLAAGFEKYISKKLVLHGFDGPMDRGVWLASDLELKGALKGYKLQVLDQIAEGNKVVTRWTLGGVHTGTILGIPASGREVHLSGISIDRIENGKSVEHWSEGNFGRFLQELQAPPTNQVTQNIKNNKVQVSSEVSANHLLKPKQVAAAFYASYNGDLAAGFEKYISKKLVLHGFDGPMDRGVWLASDLELKAALKGYKLEVLDQIVEGNKVVTRWTLGGVHTGTILGIPASGREVHLSGISIDRIVNGKSVEHWSEGNFGRFLQEISTPLNNQQDPKQVAAAFYASYNGDLAAGFDKYISKDLVLHGFDGPMDRGVWLASDLELKGALKGYKLEVLDQIVEGNKVVTRWTLGGVHTGTILGIPASGREVHLSGISIDRIVNGKSVEHWSEGNFGRFLQEIATPLNGK